MKAWSCHQFELALPEGHRFPMSKYRLLHERVEQAARCLDISLHLPPAATDVDLLRVHASHYVERICSGIGVEADMRRIGFPWSPQMIERSRRSSGASMQALRCAIEGDGISVNLAGGTHHAAHDRGGGYCVFNNSVVAAR
jgi:acetoin utilization deacetylase AcuC-like enzyme